MAEAPVDPIIKKYFDVIKAATGSAFKSYYYGDPIRIPNSSLPALIGARRSSRTSTASNAEDIHRITLVFTVVSDVRNDIQDDKTMTAGNARLYDLIEGRDESTLQLKSSSLLGILRKQALELDPAHQLWGDIDSPTQIDYGLVANKRANPSWSIEGAITTVASLVQIR